MTTKKIRYADLRKAEYRLKKLQEDYLIQNGWSYTCQTPGSFWLWEHVVKAGKMRLSFELAVEMTKFVELGTYTWL